VEDHKVLGSNISGKEPELGAVLMMMTTLANISAFSDLASTKYLIFLILI
jgi:hypothetical protein